jgi:hypothetical protein
MQVTLEIIVQILPNVFLWRTPVQFSQIKTCVVTLEALNSYFTTIRSTEVIKTNSVINVLCFSLIFRCYILSTKTSPA